jgi:hypothetical protein
MVNCLLIVEGGGQGPSLKARMAEGFRRLLDRIDPPLAKPRIVRGGGRAQALDKFNTAWNSRKPGDIVLLLIDSEEPVEIESSKIAHLVARDGWKNKPDDVTEDDVFLMVCVMETWICADQDALSLFYNGGLDRSKLPPMDRLERVLRTDLYNALERATRDCKKRTEYSKGGHSFELVGKLNPAKLRALPHAEQFFAMLEKKLRRK